MTTPFMGMTIPTVSLSTDYVTTLNDFLTTFDEHDHITSGNYLNQNSVNWSELDMSSNYVGDIASLQFSNQSTITQTNSLLVKNYELNFLNSSSTYIQITKDGFVDSIGVYNGFYGNMSLNNATCQYTVFYSSGSTDYYGYLFQSGSSTVENSNVYCSRLYTTNTGAMVIYDLVVNSSFTLNSQVSMYVDANINETNTTLSENWFFIDETGYFKCSTIETSVANILLDGSSTSCTPAFLYQNTNTASDFLTPINTITNTLTNTNVFFIAQSSSSYDTTGTIYSYTGTIPLSTGASTARGMMQCYTLINDIFSHSGSSLPSDFTYSNIVCYQRYLLTSTKTTVDYYGNSSAAFSVQFRVPTYTTDTDTAACPHIPLVVTPTIVWGATTSNIQTFKCSISQTCNLCNNGNNLVSVYAPYGNYYFIVTVYDTVNGVYITSDFDLMVEVFALASTEKGV